MTIYGTASVLPNSIRSLPVVGMVGALLSGQTRDVVNGDTGSAEVWTLTASGATNSTTYVVTLKDANGETVTTASYTSDGSATTSEISAGLFAAINANPLFGVYGSAVATSATSNTFTGNLAGRAFSLTSSSGDVVAAQSTAASSGTDIGVGTAVVVKVIGAGSGGATPIAYRPYAGAIAKEGGGVVSYSAGAVYFVTITLYPGQSQPETYQMAVAADTNTATTRAAIVTAINAAMPANTVLATSGSAGAFTLLAEVAGLDFSVTVSSIGGTLTFSFTQTALGTNFDDIFAGITTRRADISSMSIVNNEAAYPPGRAMQATHLPGSRVVIANPGGTINYHDSVFIGVGTSNNGEIFAASGANRVRLNPALAWFEQQSDGRAVLNLNYV